jgi:translation initiation factor eIF-2B subunit alpha
MNKAAVAERFRQLVQENLASKTNTSSSSLAVIAITVLTSVIESSTSTTMMELNDELKSAVECIKHTAMNELADIENLHTSTISLYSGCELFMRFVTRQFLEIKDFNACKTKLMVRGKQMASLSSQSKKKIIKLFEPFFRDGMTVMIIGYSRVVMSVLLHAAQDLNRRFSVIVPEGRPDGEGYRSANELQQAGIPVTLIVDSAVAHVMGTVDFVLSGAEGIVESGGAINKIGTYQVAIIAKMHKKPFYVTAESIKFVRQYPIEQSDISNIEYINRPAYVNLPETGNDANNTTTSLSKPAMHLDSNVSIKNPTSDFTPPGYISLLFTDLGILTPSGVSDELIKLYT